MKKNRLVYIVRLIISLSLLYLILSKTDLTPIRDIWPKFRFSIYLFAVILVFLQQYLFGINWKLSLASKGYIFKTKTLFQAILVGIFFGTFLPANVGADIVLTFNIGRALSKKHDAVSSLLFIRLISIFTILFISFICMLRIPAMVSIRPILAFILCIIITLYIVATHKHVRSRASHMFMWLKKHPFTRFIYETYISFSEYGKRPGLIIKIVFISSIASILKISIDYIIAVSLGIKIPFIYFLALTPIVSIITLIPASIAGLGIKEGAYIGLFSLLGIPPATSFTISIMSFTLNLWMLLAGGIIYTIKGSHIKYETS